MKIWQNAEESISVSCKQGLQDEIGGKEEPIVQEVQAAATLLQPGSVNFKK